MLAASFSGFDPKWDIRILPMTGTRGPQISPIQYLLFVDLKTARALGLTAPVPVVARANQLFDRSPIGPTRTSRDGCLCAANLLSCSVSNIRALRDRKHQTISPSHATIAASCTGCHGLMV
jgi:cytochrome c553